MGSKNDVKTNSRVRRQNKSLTPSAAARKAFEEFLAGADRLHILNRLEKSFGTAGIFAFGQVEYYYNRKAA